VKQGPVLRPLDCETRTSIKTTYIQSCTANFNVNEQVSLLRWSSY